MNQTRIILCTLAMCAAGLLSACGDTAPECDPDQVRCDGACIDPLTDASYCGAQLDCNGDTNDGTTCDAGEVCNGAGVCEVFCGSGLVDCGGTCIDPDTDRDHCGASADCAAANAGASCADGEICDGNGSCAISCQAGLVDCGGTCIDPDTDNAYCGASADCAGENAGEACDPGETCDGSGSCALTCQAGLIACGGTCIDPATSRAFCGASADCTGPNAGVMCAGGELCDGMGSCALSCQVGLVACGGTCIDPNTNRAFCGASDDCAAGNAGAACADGEACNEAGCVPSPTITDISPALGSTTGGDEVIITGINFDPNGGMSVTVGALSPTVTMVTQTEVRFTLPANVGNVGLYDVSVSDVYGRDDTVRDGFRYYYGTVSFAASTSVEVGTVRGLDVGDFDHDGNMDVAVANGANEMITLVGLGGGMFTASAPQAVNQTPANLAAVDLDRDTFDDIVVNTSGGAANINTFVNDRDGGFSNRQLNSSPMQQRSNATFGDLNEDGLVDMVYGGREAFAIHLGNGDGTFAGGSSHQISNQKGGVALGHFDADNHLDIVVYDTGDDDLYVFPGNGDGTIGTAVPVILDLGGSGRIVLGDFNGDMRPDVAISLGGAVQVLLGDGMGSLGAPTAVMTSGNDQQEIAVADMNADTYLDLVVGNGNDDSVTVLFGAGDGTFPTAVPVTGMDNARSIETADFNGDGRVDFVVTDNREGDPDGVSIFLSMAQ